MSCGSKTCASAEIPRHREIIALASWLARAMCAMIDRARRRQLWFELEKTRQRGLLKDLDDRMLKDLGITREQADREARKPFWR